jgi:hypothetical protein
MPSVPFISPPAFNGFGASQQFAPGERAQEHDLCLRGFAQSQNIPFFGVKLLSGYG